MRTAHTGIPRTKPEHGVERGRATIAHNDVVRVALVLSTRTVVLCPEGLVQGTVSCKEFLPCITGFLSMQVYSI